MERKENCDIVVIGAGSAAHGAARESGAGRVIVLAVAAEAEFGGNARTSHTGFRFVYDGGRKIHPLPRAAGERQ